MRTIKIALFAAALCLTACKKKDDKAAEATKTAEPTKADDKAAPAPTPTPAPGAGAMSDSEIETKGMEVMNKMADMFAADAKDCAKLATDLKAFLADNKATLDAMDAYDKKQTPEQKKAWNEKHKADDEAIQNKMTPALNACGSNADVQAAIKALPGS